MVGLAYSAIVFKRSKQEEEGFFVCNQDGSVCELSQHIHSDIEVSTCGEDVDFEREEGRIDELHTHKEKDKIHWHDRLKVDPKTREPIEPSRSTIKAFFAQMDYELPSRCPNNSNPELEVTVNGLPAEAGLDYTWVDGDQITVNYN